MMTNEVKYMLEVELIHQKNLLTRCRGKERTSVHMKDHWERKERRILNIIDDLKNCLCVVSE